MINEIEALLGILIVVIIIYFFIWSKSKIIGSIALILTSLSLLVPFEGTNYEMIAWMAIMASFTSAVIQIAIQKTGKTTS